MAWKYHFDDGPEKSLECADSLYQIAAMAAFSQEQIKKLPDLTVSDSKKYTGHVLKIWNSDVSGEFGPYLYGIGLNESGGLTIITLI